MTLDSGENGIDNDGGSSEQDFHLGDGDSGSSGVSDGDDDHDDMKRHHDKDCKRYHSNHNDDNGRGSQ